MSKKFCIYDVESESLCLLGSNRPWQLSWLITDEYKILEQHDYYLWFSDLNVSKEAATITRFNWDYYKEHAIDPKKVFDKFEQYRQDSSVTICHYNGLQFDEYIINILRKELGLESDYSHIKEGRVLDIHALTKAYKFGMSFDKKHDDFVAFQYRAINSFQKGIKTSLGQLGKDFNIQFEEEKKHAGLYDCFLTFEVMKKLLYIMDLRGYIFR